MDSDALVREDRREWATAFDVQQRFMRRMAPIIDAVDYSAKCRQAHELGGDCYDFVPLAESRLALAVGDASGKGLAAALMISNVQSSLRTAALFAGNDRAAMLGAVNRPGPCDMSTPATLRLSSCGETARSIGLRPAAHP